MEDPWYATTTTSTSPMGEIAAALPGIVAHVRSELEPLGERGPWDPSLTSTRRSRSVRSMDATAGSAPSWITCRSRPSGPGSRSRSSGSSTHRPAGRARVRRLTGDEKARLRAIVDEFGAEEIEEMAAPSESPSRRQGGRVFPQGAALDDRPADEDRGLAELIHFCCTSEDINNRSYALMVQRRRRGRVAPTSDRAGRESSHDGQRPARRGPARPHPRASRRRRRRWARNSAVLTWRLQRQLRRVEDAEFLGKLNGATGTYGPTWAAVPGPTGRTSANPSSRAWA